MGVIITPQSEIDKYFESDALSQSKMKTLLKGFDAFLADQQQEEELYYKEKGHFVIGSAVDTILTGEEGEFEKQYYVSQIEKKPSDVEMSIINMVFDDVTDEYKPEEWINSKLSDLNGLLENAIIEHNWYNGKPGEKRMQGLIDRGAEYFEVLKSAFGKQVISQKQKQLIDDIVSSLKTDARTSKYFDRTQLSRIQEVDVYYQLPIYFEYMGINCKALLDMLIVFKDEKNEPVSFHPIDLKTMTGNTLKFISNVKSFRYDIQGAWYREALLNENSSFNVSNNFNVTKDILKPFTFIVESSTEPGRPLVYEMSNNLLKIGKEGRPEVKLIDTENLFIDDNYKDFMIMKEIRGFDSLVEEYIYYENNGWKQDKLLDNAEKNNGVLKLDWDNIS